MASPPRKDPAHQGGTTDDLTGVTDDVSGPAGAAGGAPTAGAADARADERRSRGEPLDAAREGMAGNVDSDPTPVGDDDVVADMERSGADVDQPGDQLT